MDSPYAELTAALAAHAHAYDRSGEWPARCMEAYTAAGAWAWAVPQAYGGALLPAPERLAVYAALARGDMSTALYVTQFTAAVDQIAESGNEALKRDVLPRYARGEALTTIGYSQITTSRHAGPNALAARADGADWVLDGMMPWVTGALHCESVVTGATCPDGRQVLLLVPLDAPGVRIDPPLALLALDSSQTSRVRCQGARIAGARLLAGPVANVLGRGGPERILTVSATGIGLLQALVDAAREQEARSLPDAPSPSAVLAPRVEALYARLLRCAERERATETDTTEDITALRSEVNDLLVRAAGVLLTLAKGTGYTREHPAQRLVREAMFFCVWSATDPVRANTIGRLLDGTGEG